MMLAGIANSLALAVLPWLPLSRAHGRGVSHPLASLISLILIFALIAWAFRRKTS